MAFRHRGMRSRGMTDLLRTVIALLLIYVTARLLYLFFERVRTVIRLLSLRKKGLTVHVSPRALFSILKPSKKRRRDGRHRRDHLPYQIFQRKKLAFLRTLRLGALCRSFFEDTHFDLGAVFKGLAQRSAAERLGRYVPTKGTYHRSPDVR